METGSSNGALARLAAKDAKGFARAEAEGRPFFLPEVPIDFLAWWRDEVLRKHGQQAVCFLEVCGSTSRRALLEATLGTFAEECERLSGRERFALLQSELLAEDPALVQLLWRNLPLLPRGEEEFFHRWPRKLAPALMLQLAGAGARTQLQRRSWAPQWILCATGRMRLKLLPPRCQEELKPSKEPFGVLDEAGRAIFSVCDTEVSDLDLFAVRFDSHLDIFGPDLQQWPEADRLLVLEVLLRPGDVAVLPADWWVQCYSEEASWSLHGQYCSAAGLEWTLGTVLGHAKVGPEEIFGYAALPAEEKVDAVLAAALAASGRGEGRQLLKRLRGLDQDLPAPASPQRACAVCGRPATTRCGRCRELALCGAECQRRSWPEHRKICVAELQSSRRQSNQTEVDNLRQQVKGSDEALADAIKSNEALREQMELQRLDAQTACERDLKMWRDKFQQHLEDQEEQHRVEQAEVARRIKALEEVLGSKAGKIQALREALAEKSKAWHMGFPRAQGGPAFAANLGGLGHGVTLSMNRLATFAEQCSALTEAQTAQAERKKHADEAAKILRERAWHQENLKKHLEMWRLLCSFPCRLVDPISHGAPFDEEFLGRRMREKQEEYDALRRKQADLEARKTQLGEEAQKLEREIQAQEAQDAARAMGVADLRREVVAEAERTKANLTEAFRREICISGSEFGV
ncbi:unnamed protein product [Effrenium voratum]|uniref:MYND-type domain-containing protein n=1 Tax=Effrenium voratum TaxID=2562239 RepID=A0AA36JNX0_9DINO|nr:unnamed protein product [Effrenium voratum]